MQDRDQGIERAGLLMSRRDVLRLGAIWAVAACSSPENPDAHPVPSTLPEPGPVAPISPPPSEQASETPATERPAPTETEAPLITREMKPRQHLGKIEVNISRPDALKKVITHNLFTDPRSKKEIDKWEPVNPDGPATQKILNRGFMVHRDSYVPGWNEIVAKPGKKGEREYFPTIIAGHRVTQIKGSPYGSRVLRDIEQIKTGKDGDLLMMTLKDGTVAQYRAVSRKEVRANDLKTISKIFLTTSKIETLWLYACDTSDPGGVPKQGKYTADTRHFVKYVRIN